MIKRNIIAFVIIIFVILLAGLIYKIVQGIPIDYGDVNQDAINVSIIDLIANPEKYDGKTVRVKVVGTIEFEGDAVYLTKDDYKNIVSKNAIYLKLGFDLSKIRSKLKKLNGEYVLVEGVFNSKDTGHFNLFSGTIEKVSRYRKCN